jgi:hypothetical protein
MPNPGEALRLRVAVLYIAVGVVVSLGLPAAVAQEETGEPALLVRARSMAVTGDDLGPEWTLTEEQATTVAEAPMALYFAGYTRDLERIADLSGPWAMGSFVAVAEEPLGPVLSLLLLTTIVDSFAASFADSQGIPSEDIEEVPGPTVGSATRWVTYANDAAAFHVVFFLVEHGLGGVFVLGPAGALQQEDALPWAELVATRMQAAAPADATPLPAVTPQATPVPMTATVAPTRSATATAAPSPSAGATPTPVPPVAPAAPVLR